MTFHPVFVAKHPVGLLLLAFGSGVLMSLAAAPLNWWPLAWVALAPLWVIVRLTPPIALGRSLLCTAAWGLGYHGLTLSWILGLHPLTWMGVPWLASVAIALFCWGFITAWGTIANLIWAWVMSRMSRSHHPEQRGVNWPPDADTPLNRYANAGIGAIGFRILVGTALWCGLEWLLNLTPLSWTSLSFTQSPGNNAILHLGRWSGPLLVSAVIVAFNGLLAEAWIVTRRRLPAGSARTCVTIAGVLVVITHAIGYGMAQQPLGDRPEQALTIGIVQGNIPTRQKLSTDGIRRAIRGYVGGYESLANQGVDAVLTPEGALPFLWDPTRNPLREAVVEKQVPAWLGSFVEDQGKVTQSLLSLDKQGEVVGRYNKIKLVPLGEYIPFQDVLGGLIGRLSPIKTSMVPGQVGQVFHTPFGQAIASICYESVFPDLFRQQASGGGQFILTASNLDPYSEVLMTQHQAHDLMRAIETDRWAARATNTGYSGIISPHGEIIWRSQPHTYQLHAERIYRRQIQTPYVRWGDWFTPLLIGLTTLLLVAQRLRFFPFKS